MIMGHFEGQKGGAMKDFIQISKYAGMREDLVQAGGGNSSEKLDGNRMVIKASGIQMADITEKDGYSIVDYQAIRQYMDILAGQKLPDEKTKILEETLLTGRRPSIETYLHAITGRVTLHTHSVAVNVLAARQGGMEELQGIFPDALCVDYATPGLKLAQVYYRSYLQEMNRKKREIHRIFLKNHGVVISGDSAEEVIQISEETNKTIEDRVGMDCQAYRHGFEIYKNLQGWGIGDKKLVVKAENKIILDAYQACGYSLWDYQMCPDCVVFCGKHPMDYEQISGRESLQNFLSCYGEPILISYGKDLFIRGESIKKAREIESVLAFSAQVFLLNQGQSLEILSSEEQNFLLNWDAEKYRQKIT